MVAGSAAANRANSAHRAAIFRLVAWSNGLVTALDYNMPAIDEKSGMPNSSPGLE